MEKYFGRKLTRQCEKYETKTLGMTTMKLDDWQQTEIPSREVEVLHPHLDRQKKKRITVIGLVERCNATSSVYG